MDYIPDPNSLKKTCVGLVTNSSAMPDTSDYNFMCFASTTNGFDFGIQIAIKRATAICYIRQRCGGAWGEWYQFN